MDNITEHVEFVKSQAAFHQKKAAYFERRSQKFPADKDRADAHKRMERRFEGLSDFLTSLASNPTQRRSSGSTSASLVRLSPEEIDGLPSELLQELSLSEADKADFAVLSVVDEAGGILSLDKIIVALYRKTGEIVKRTPLNARIYRMVQRGDMYAVQGRKGIYSTRELTEEEVASIS